MWVYNQSTGKLTRDGNLIATGYSGHEWAKNNPGAENVQGMGPIPEGLWKINSMYDSPNTGPKTLVLTPDKATNTFGRSGFRIHGDSITHPGAASHGCIIFGRSIREMIWQSNDRNLTVTK